MAAPTDPAFYDAVIPMALRLGSKPEDLLWIWASETGYDPALKGESRTISTLMHSGVVPSLLTEAEWGVLPALSPTDQLPFVERYYKVIHDRYLGRGFQDAFEAYLANAGPGMLRRDGQYNQASVLYGDPNEPAAGVWANNYPMDNFPVARQQATKRGVELTLDFAKQLVSEGLLKGWITLGDLKNFMMRGDVVALANDAIKRLHDERAQLQMQVILTPAGYMPPSSAPYTPDFSKSFGNPDAPIDTRVAQAMPRKRSLFSLPEVILVTGAVYLALRWLKK